MREKSVLSLVSAVQPIAALALALALVGGGSVDSTVVALPGNPELVLSEHIEPPPFEDIGLVLFDDANATWHIRYPDATESSFRFGEPGDVPLLGDWDCDGDRTIGTYRAASGVVSVRNTNGPGPADGRFVSGQRADWVLSGDWDGDGCDTLATYRSRQGKVWYSNTLGFSTAGAAFYFGVPGDRPVAGDFDGDGIDGIGVRRESTGRMYLRNNLSTGVADLDFYYGIGGDLILMGDWDHDGTDTVSVFRPSDARFYLTNSNQTEAAVETIAFGEQSWTPVSVRGRVQVDRPATEGILWTGGHEGGTTAEWNNIAISGVASVSATTERAHTGSYSAKLVIDTSSGKSGVRPGIIEILPDYVRKEPKNLPDAAFYSAYYLFPEDVTPGDAWWIVMQWKDEEAGVTLHPTWMINAWDWEDGGEMRFTLRRGVGVDNQPIMPHVVEASAPVSIPLGRWVHLECFYEWSIEPEGRIACWQDGLPIWDLTNLRTDLDMGYRHFPRQWTTTNYSEETTPAHVEIFVDDAAISLSRLGPDWR